MKPEHELIHLLASRLQTALVGDALPTPEAAIVRFLQAVHRSRCPRCGGRRWRPSGDAAIDCRRCGTVSVYEGTPWRRRRLAVRVVLFAVHAILVADETPTSRGFARAHRMRLETAWRLLHGMRDALPYFLPALPGLRRPLLGACARSNRADVWVSFGSGRLTVTQPSEGTRFGGHLDRGQALVRQDEMTIWFGRLRAWLTTHFRGVSKRHLSNYLGEFAFRHERFLLA